MLTKMYVKCAAFFCSLKNDERGVTAIEYAIIAVAIAGIVAAVFGTGDTDSGLGFALKGAINDVITALGGKPIA